jgi:hypothetical protein
MCVFRNENRWDTSNVQFENGVIRRYSKKFRMPEMLHIDWGLGMLKACAVATRSTDEPWDLAELYEELATAGRLAGYEMARRFYEIGSFEGLAETNRLLCASLPHTCCKLADHRPDPVLAGGARGRNAVDPKLDRQHHLDPTHRFENER